MIFAENFESGTRGNFDSETDVGNQLDIVNYKALGNYPWAAVPYTGAFASRIVLNGGVADAFFTKAIAIADATADFFRFEVMFSSDFRATADDVFSILELQGAASAITGSIGFRITAATQEINVGIGSAAAAAVPATFAPQVIDRGVWYVIETKFGISTSGAGLVDLYISRDGSPKAPAPVAQLSAKTNIAVTAVVLGVQDQLATTQGVILVGSLGVDSARLSPRQRYDNDPVLSISGHAFVGPGYISAAAILGGTMPTMALYDTDIGDTSQPYTVYLDAAMQTSVGGPIFFERGCYMQLTGANAIGQVMLVRSDPARGVFGPTYYDDAGVRRLARGG
jgi:hypothetical protein